MSLENPLTRLLSLMFLFAFLLAGCLGGDDTTPPAGDDPDGDGEGDDGTGDGDDPDGGDGDGNGDGDDGENGEEVPCEPSTDNAASFSHDGLASPDPAGWDPSSDPTLIFAQTSNETFTVEEGTVTLIVHATAGLHVSLGWEIVLIDPTGSTQYTFPGEAGPGENVTGSANISDPAPGEWTIGGYVTGYVEGLEFTVDAEGCQ